jgi:hypothetical protein
LPLPRDGGLSIKHDGMLVELDRAYFNAFGADGEDGARLWSSVSPQHETFTFADDYGAAVTTRAAWWANHMESPDVAIAEVDILAEQAMASWLHESLKHADQALHLVDHLSFVNLLE